MTANRAQGPKKRAPPSRKPMTGPSVTQQINSAPPPGGFKQRVKDSPGSKNLFTNIQAKGPKRTLRIHLENEIVKQVAVDSTWTVERSLKDVKKKIKIHNIDDFGFALYETSSDSCICLLKLIHCKDVRELNDPDMLLSQTSDSPSCKILYKYKLQVKLLLEQE